MPVEYQNIYKTARRSAGLTQEAAAERLALSVESIRAYETGQRVPHNSIVARMAVTYNNLMLGYEHCRNTDDLMASIIPHLEQRTMMEAVIRLYNRLRRLEQNGSVARLLEIAEDGKIDPAEQIDYADIVREIGELIQVGLELQLSPSQVQEGVSPWQA